MSALAAAKDALTAKIGQETGTSDWHQITQEQVNLFADATGDHQWIHVDEEKAKGFLGTTIAHGYLTLSLLPALSSGGLAIEGVTRGINYGSNKVRFTNMVPTGSKVRCVTKLKGVEEKGGGLLLTNDVTMEIEGQERPAMIAETLTMIFFD